MMFDCGEMECSPMLTEEMGVKEGSAKAKSGVADRTEVNAMIETNLLILIN